MQNSDNIATTIAGSVSSVSFFAIALPAEFVANDKPILVKYQDGYYMPVLKFYPETAFGGDFRTEAAYRDPEVKCLIRTGGLEAVEG